MSRQFGFNVIAPIAIDTNVLVYAINEDDPHHYTCRRFMSSIASGFIPACLLPQNLLEFYAVVTDAKRVLHPIAPLEAMAELARLRAVIPVIEPREGALDFLAALASTGGPIGADVYDAFIVAQMQDSGISTICTYNLRDFRGFPVTSTTPEEIMAALGISEGGSGIVQDRPMKG
ncbi:MAG: type II toxin-antitoxin system VapC family toxin [Bacillota bacterium]